MLHRIPVVGGTLFRRLIVAVLVVGGLVVIGQAAGWYDVRDLLPGNRVESAGRLGIKPPDPVAGETITLTGRLTTPVSRLVFLEVRRDGRWDTAATANTDASGGFRLKARAPAEPVRYRVRAPAQAGAAEGGMYRPQLTRSRKVKPVRPRANLAFVPAPIGQSPSGEQDLTPATARFRPAREGREVVFQRRSGGGWDDVATARQDRSGAAYFNVSSRSGRTTVYRAVASRHAGAAPVTSRPARPRTVEVVWNDEFNGDALDTTKWAYRQLGERNIGSSRPCGVSAGETVSVAGGSARFLLSEIIPAQDPVTCPHGEFTNANIGTGPTYAFTFGIMAARIKFQRQDGQHGAFWSQPTYPPASEGAIPPLGAEIDAVEYFGDRFRKGAVQHSIYWKTPDGEAHKVGGAENRNYLLGPGKTWSNSFHVYSVEWTPKSYIFRIDGHETLRTRRGVSQVPQHLILSLITSDWEIARINPAKLDPMFVDWVRVWQPSQSSR